MNDKIYLLLVICIWLEQSIHSLDIANFRPSRFRLRTLVFIWLLKPNKKNLSYHSFLRFVWVTESLLKLSWKSGLLPISHFSSIYFSIFLSIFHQVLAHILLKLSERTKTPYDTIFLNYYSFPDAPLKRRIGRSALYGIELP